MSSTSLSRSYLALCVCVCVHTHDDATQTKLQQDCTYNQNPNLPNSQPPNTPPMTHTHTHACLLFFLQGTELLALVFVIGGFRINGYFYCLKEMTMVIVKCMDSLMLKSEHA